MKQFIKMIILESTHFTQQFKETGCDLPLKETGYEAKQPYHYEEKLSKDRLCYMKMCEIHFQLPGMQSGPYGWPS